MNFYDQILLENLYTDVLKPDLLNEDVEDKDLSQFIKTDGDEEYFDFEEYTDEGIFNESDAPTLERYGVSVDYMDRPVGLRNLNVAVLSYEGEDHYFVQNYKHPLEYNFFTTESNFSDFLDQKDVDELVDVFFINEDNVHMSGWETSIGEISKNPGTFYHYTIFERLEGIVDDEILIPSYGTSLGNRGTRGIFTSVSPETFADGSYGDILISINLDEWAKENDVDGSFIVPEPSVFEGEVKAYVAYSFQRDDYYFQPEQGESEETAIIQEPIPIKYLKFTWNKYDYEGLAGAKKLLEEYE